MLKYLLWDIDGTLLRTNRAGMQALIKTIKEIHDKSATFENFDTAGRSDRYIIRRLLEDVLSRRPTSGEVLRFIRYYENLLPEFLHANTGTLLPNVKEILEHLSTQKEKYYSLLLTGNTSAGAYAKTSHFDIGQYFDIPHSAFGDYHESRNQIAEQALYNIKRINPLVSEAQIIIIGDTEHDIECAHHIEAKCIAVATGGTTYENLAKLNPWKLYHTLPDKEEFVKVIDSI